MRPIVKTFFYILSWPFDEECEACGGKRVQRNTQPPQPCAPCDGRGFGEPVVCMHCKGKGSTEEFFQGRVVVPSGAAAGARIQIAGRPQYARIHVMPSKIFSRDGATITSVLKLTAEEADAGGFFEVETLHGKETVFIDEGAKSGDSKTLQGKGLPLQRKARAGAGGEDVPKGDHVVKLEVARRKTPEPEPEIEPEPVPAAAAAAAEDDNDDDDQDDDAPPAKKAKKVEAAGGGGSGSGSAQTTTSEDLEALLAEKKRALLAALEAKTSGGA